MSGVLKTSSCRGESSSAPEVRARWADVRGIFWKGAESRLDQLQKLRERGTKIGSGGSSVTDREVRMKAEGVRLAAEECLHPKVRDSGRHFTVAELTGLHICLMHVLQGVNKSMDSLAQQWIVKKKEISATVEFMENEKNQQETVVQEYEEEIHTVDCDLTVLAPEVEAAEMRIGEPIPAGSVSTEDSIDKDAIIRFATLSVDYGEKQATRRWLCEVRAEAKRALEVSEEVVLKVKGNADELDSKVSHAMTRMQDFVDAVSHPEYFDACEVIDVPASMIALSE